MAYLLVLQCVVPQDIRRVVCCRLAEVLLHGISDVNYRPPEPASTSAAASAVKNKSVMSAVSSDSPWKPKRHYGANLYVPNNKNEEVRWQFQSGHLDYYVVT
jgi:hypothetical protein